MGRFAPKGPVVMYRITRMRNRKAFTLVEVMVATFITLYTITAAWSSYVMFWTWWHETHPEVEAQRMARIAISTIICGKMDPTAGTYDIGTATFKRRNGIAQATRVEAIPTTPPEGAQYINFGLEPDSSNARSYYLGVDPVSGYNVVYYRDSANTISKIDSTIGVTDLRFQNYTEYYTNPPFPTVHYDMVVVTVTVDRNITGTGVVPHNVHVVYSQLVYLKNVP